MNLVTTLLQDRTEFVESLETSKDIKKQILSLLLTRVIAFATYGFIIGLHQNILQALASMIKLPVLYLITHVCPPFLFSIVL